MENPHPGRTIDMVVVSFVNLVDRPIRIGDMVRLMPDIRATEIQAAVWRLVDQGKLSLEPNFTIRQRTEPAA